MPTIVDCPSCSRKLRVPDDLLGQKVKCPTCGGIFDAVGPSHVAPPSSELASGSAATPESSASAERTPAYSPLKLSLDEADTPAASPSDNLARPVLPLGPKLEPLSFQDDGNLKSCPYCGERISAVASRCRFCGEEVNDEEDDRPWERRRPVNFGVRRDCEPHRGTMILVFGIISVVTVAIYFLSFIGLPLGIAAWVMGHKDLKKMKNNVMDPAGRGLTQAGWICGIIGTVLDGLWLLCCGGFIGFSVLSNANSPANRRPLPQPTPAPIRKIEWDAAPLRVRDDLPRLRP